MLGPAPGADLAQRRGGEPHHQQVRKRWTLTAISYRLTMRRHSRSMRRTAPLVTLSTTNRILDPHFEGDAIDVSSPDHNPQGRSDRSTRCASARQASAPRSALTIIDPVARQPFDDWKERTRPPTRHG